MLRRIAIVFLLLLLIACAYFGINYARHDREHLTLNDNLRHSVSGSFIRLSRGYTHYQLAGPASAPTVVLIHGFSVPYYLWDHTFDPLVGAGFRVLRYDIYGRGYSDRPVATYNAELFDTQILDLLNALDIRSPVALVGASMGGSLAAGFAARHPERVSRVALLDPGYFSNDTLPFAMRAPILSSYIMDVNIAPAMPGGQRDDFVHPERFPDYFPKYDAQMQIKGFRRAILSTIQNYLTVDDSADFRRLGQSHLPVFVLWGTADRDVPFDVSKKVLADVPQAEFHPLEGRGHVSFYEEPETVNPLLIQFLKR